MHFMRKFNKVVNFGRKAYNTLTTFARKSIDEHIPRISQSVEEVGKRLNQYGDAIGHERLSRLGKDLHEGPLISHDLQKRFIDKALNQNHKFINSGFAAGDNLHHKMNTMMFS